MRGQDDILPWMGEQVLINSRMRTCLSEPPSTAIDLRYAAFR